MRSTGFMRRGSNWIQYPERQLDSLNHVSQGSWTHFLPRRHEIRDHSLHGGFHWNGLCYSSLREPWSKLVHSLLLKYHSKSVILISS